MPYEFDDQHAPLISMHIHGWLSDPDFERLFADLEQLDARGRAYAVVLDCSGLRVPEIDKIRRLRSWLESPASISEHQCGLACVAETPMLRGTLAALLKSRPRRSPILVTDDVDAGRRWATERLVHANTTGVGAGLLESIAS